MLNPKPWPPDDVLRLVGMTREEWDDMAAGMARENIPWDWLVESAVRKALRRRRDELAR